MMRTLPYILLGLIVYAVLFYLDNFQPALLNTLLIQVDVFGVTHIAEQEQARLAKIKSLKDDSGYPLAYQYKLVLINHTVFMGASPEMVRLALNEPAGCIIDGHYIPGPVNNATCKTPPQAGFSYVYYLPDDTRPTIFVFENDKLVNACKGSSAEPSTCM